MKNIYKSSNLSIKKRNYILLFMVLPFVTFIVMFCYVPIFGWIYAFYNYKPGIPLSRTPFVGLQNFRYMIQDIKEIRSVLTNTLAMSFLNLACAPLPVLLAIMLNEMKSIRFKKFAQTVTTIPNFVSWVIVFSMAFALFSYNGMTNQLLELMNLAPKKAYSLLSDGENVWFIQLAFGNWKSLGWSSIIYLAAIAGIDGELYDAAAIDGANRFQINVHVTVPGVMPTFIVLLLLSVSSLVSVGFDQYFIFKNPMTADKIEVLDLYIYRMGIANNDYAFATAVGMLKTFVSVLLLFSVNIFSKKVRGQAVI